MTSLRAAQSVPYLSRLGFVAFLWLAAAVAPAHAGCGSGFSEIAPDAPFGYDFGPACDTHDECYDTCGKSRGDCDEQFRRDMQAVCDIVRDRHAMYRSLARIEVGKARRAPIYRIDQINYHLARAAYYEAYALRTLPQIAACVSLAEAYYRAVLNFGRGPYCSAQAAKKCCPQNFECVDVYDCPAPKPPATAIGTDSTGTTGDLSPAHTASLQAAFQSWQSSVPVTTGTVIWMGTDQSKFCRYTPENMTPVPVGGGTVTTNGGGNIGGTGTNNGGGNIGGTGTNNGGGNIGGTGTNNGGTATTNGGGNAGGGTIVVTPGNGANDGEDPKDTDKPDETGPTTIYVNVKASASDMAAGAQGAVISTMHVKLFPSAVANPTLPGNGVKKDTNTGAGDDPAQALTDSNGEATIGIVGAAFGLGNDAANRVNVAVNLDPTVTAVTTAPGQLLPGYTKPDEIFTINGETFWVFYVPESTANALASDGTIKIVLCIIKKPVGAHEYDAFAPPPPFSRLPGATISFGETQGAL